MQFWNCVVKIQECNAKGLFSLGLLLLASAALCADGWNQFRGPDGSGIAPDSRPPIKIDAAKPTWKIALPPGHSAPVLSARRIFITGLEQGRLVTLAFDKATGKPAWRRAAPMAVIERVHTANSPAAPSALVDKDRVFVWFGSFGLLCYDHDGRELWRKPIPTPRTLYGTSTSPIAHRDKLILVLDNDANLPRSRLSQSKIIALHKTTGKLAWETPRPFHRSGWSTPTVWRHGDTEELVVLGNGRLCGYDLSTGQERWFVKGFSRETISSPVTGNGMVFASASKRGGGGNAKVDPEPFWKSVIHFDQNRDGKLQRKEMTGHFTFPFRPELPYGHPGYGMPLPAAQAAARPPARRHFWLDGQEPRRRLARARNSPPTFLTAAASPCSSPFAPAAGATSPRATWKWELNRGIPEIPCAVRFIKTTFTWCALAAFSQRWMRATARCSTAPTPRWPRPIQRLTGDRQGSIVSCLRAGADNGRFKNRRQV